MFSRIAAVRNADQGVRGMPVDHVLDRVGDHLTGRQRVEHAAMAHCDAVVHGDRVELAGDAAGFPDRPGHDVAEVLEVHVAGHELGIGVGDGHDGFAEVPVPHAGGPPQRSRAGGVAPMSGNAGTQCGHSLTPR
jgi:hypothetical protein